MAGRVSSKLSGVPDIDANRSGAVVVIGGTAGLGRSLAEHFARVGWEVVLSGRDARRAAEAAKGVTERAAEDGGAGGVARGVALDLTRPEEAAGALADIGPVRYLILSGFVRGQSPLTEYDPVFALEAVTAKLVGYPAVVHALLPRIRPDGSVLIFGGGLKDRPFPGSITMSTVNAGVEGLVRALALELAPIRVNGLHPAMVADSPFWSGQPAQLHAAIRERTPTGRLTTMQDVTEAAIMLLENPSANAVNLDLNGGTLVR
jgi:NAD(P)-dependent dehydrogenase (short-subunit alcohol dehydrogenase family)